MEEKRSNAHIHSLYVRQVRGLAKAAGLTEAFDRARLCGQEHDECLKLVDKVLAETDNRCEYAIYVKGLIERQRGELHSVK
jgi:hypothetical protein